MHSILDYVLQQKGWYKMLGLLFQFGYYVNYVMILIETSVSLLIVFFIAKIVTKPLLEGKGITKKKKNISDNC